jgi:hypothetical protein
MEDRDVVAVDQPEHRVTVGDVAEDRDVVAVDQPEHRVAVGDVARHGRDVDTGLLQARPRRIGIEQEQLARRSGRRSRQSPTGAAPNGIR